jgi:ribosome-binding factor A
MSGGERPRRVAEQIQRYLSSRLIPELRDPRLGFATVTSVEVSRDLKTARVYVTIYEPDLVKRKAALEALSGAAGRFRRDLGRDLRLRFTPTLTFLEDESIERADRIERLIHEIHESDTSAVPDDEDAHDDGDPGDDESE